MLIRQSTEGDFESILAIHGRAFPNEPVADLTADLLSDSTALPCLSLLALDNDRPVGHVLFSVAHLEPETPHRLSLLAPLGIIPESQGRDVGSRLVTEGLAILTRSGVSAVFVLGHPEYYPRFGFKPASSRGFAAPYPIPAEVADAWMVLALAESFPGSCSGTVKCARSLDKPEYWRE